MGGEGAGQPVCLAPVDKSMADCLGSNRGGWMAAEER